MGGVFFVLPLALALLATPKRVGAEVEDEAARGGAVGDGDGVEVGTGAEGCSACIARNRRSTVAVGEGARLAAGGLGERVRVPGLVM